MMHKRLLEQWRSTLNQADVSSIKHTVFHDDEMEDMVAVLASSAYAGGDIQNEYPLLWSQLISSQLWQETFLAMLVQLLDEEPQPAASTDQTRISRFLRKVANVPPAPELRVRRNREWRVEWRLSAVQIQQILTPDHFPNQESIVYRRFATPHEPLPQQGLELKQSTLFRSKVDVISQKIDVTLIMEHIQGSRLLNPKLEFDVDWDENVPPPSAKLRWGTYEQTVKLSADLFWVNFPPVPFDAIGSGTTLDELVIDTPLSCVVTTYQ